MSNFTFNTPSSVRVEIGGARRLAELIASLGRFANTKMLFVTDPGIMQLGLAQEALASLSAAGVSVSVFDGVEADPPSEVILRGVAQAKADDVSVVIGFGGGSAMDVAKLVAYLGKTDDRLDDIFGVGLATGQRLPLVLVPTTAGTGSEATMVSIVTVGTNEKKGVVARALLPDLAILDAELTLGLPPLITAATGVDAMVHAIEASTSRSANNNPLSQILARQALLLLGANIEEAVHNGKNLDARSAMLLGSMLAGMAFCNSPVAAVHALAYPIGALFHVAHGLSNALVLPHVMRFNAEVCRSEYAALAPLVFTDIEGASGVNDTCEAFIGRLVQLNRNLGLPKSLRAVGIEHADLPRLAADSMNQIRLLVNNPRSVTHADALAIYQQAYDA